MGKTGAMCGTEECELGLPHNHDWGKKQPDPVTSTRSLKYSQHFSLIP